MSRLIGTLFSLILLCSYDMPALWGQSPDITLTYGEAERIKHTIDGELLIRLDNLEKGERYLVHISSMGPNQPQIYSTGISSHPKQQKRMSLRNLPLSLHFEATADRYWMKLQNRNKNELSFSLLEQSDNTQARSGISIQTDYSLEELLKDVLLKDGCFDLQNMKAIGPSEGMGYFSNGLDGVGFDEGILLATGPVGTFSGPNNSTNTSAGLGVEGDEDLNVIAGTVTNDAVGFEFDFTPTVGKIVFNYAFGSEEYCEYTGSAFNDAFGFFLSGPGIDGPYSEGAVNLAKIPSSGEEVTINTINYTSHSDYYINNAPPSSYGGNCISGEVANGSQVLEEVEFDGLTVPLEAAVEVVPGETYHLKIVVADAADAIWDSGVFLETGSFRAEAKIDDPGALTCQTDSVLLQASSSSIGQNNTYRWEDVAGNTVGTESQVQVTEPGIYTLIVSNTETGCTSMTEVEVIEYNRPPEPSFGIDRQMFTVELSDHSTNYPGEWHWSFGDGSTSTLRNPTHQYQSPGLYEICLTVSNECGSEMACKTVKIDYETEGESDKDEIPCICNDMDDGKLINGDECFIFNGLSLYPNPVSERITLSKSWDQERDVTVRLMRPSGQIIRTMDEHTSSLNMAIEIQTLPDGLYILALEVDDKMYYRRVIKQ